MRLRELRRRKKLSQAKLGKLMGVTGQTILNWESGIFEPNIDQLITLANIFNVSVDYLIGRDRAKVEAQIICNALSVISYDELLEFLENQLKEK